MPIIWDNPPAFARPASTFETADGVARILPQTGMTLLDYFAGIAFGEWVRANIEGTVDDLNPSVVARESYIHARAMMAEREKPQ